MRSGEVVTVRELSEHQEFYTLLTRTEDGERVFGVVVERRHDGVLVDFGAREPRRIHPLVRVEVA